MKGKTIIFVWLLLTLLACSAGQNERKIRSVEHPVSERTGDVIFGRESAPVTIYLYASYHCNYCRYFFSRTFPGLKTNYLNPGKVKLVVKWVDFEENPQVLRALQAASCISQFGQYEKYHTLLLVNPDVVFTEKFAQLLDTIIERNTDIAQCILSDPDFSYLRSNTKEFRENNLTGTPAFILNNHIYNGFISYGNFVKLLNKEFKI